jgi:hypothetical protein
LYPPTESWQYRIKFLIPLSEVASLKPMTSGTDFSACLVSVIKWGEGIPGTSSMVWSPHIRSTAIISMAVGRMLPLGVAFTWTEARKVERNQNWKL